MPTGTQRLAYSEAGGRAFRKVLIVLRAVRGGGKVREIHGKSYGKMGRWVTGRMSGSVNYIFLENVVFEMESEEESEE